MDIRARSCNRKVKLLNGYNKIMVDGLRVAAFSVHATLHQWVALSCDVLMNPARKISNRCMGAAARGASAFRP
jgi:hypothetical protein